MEGREGSSFSTWRPEKGSGSPGLAQPPARRRGQSSYLPGPGPLASSAPRWPQSAASSRQVRPSTRASAASAAARGNKQCPSRVLRQPRASAQLWVQPVGPRSPQLRAARLKLEQQLRAQRRQHGCWDAQQDHRGQHPAAVRAGHVRGPAEPGGSGGVCEIFEEQGGWGNSGSPEGGGVAGVSESWELQGSRGASRSGKDETPRKLRTKSFFLPHWTLRAPPPGLQVLGAGPARGGAEKGRGSP